jgi:hypothetical protein
MSIIIKLLPIILLLTIFYLFFTDLYPKYQELLSLVKKFNELKIKEKEVISAEELISSLEKNELIKVFSENGRKDLLEVWLPSEPKKEELLIYLGSLYNAFALPASLPAIGDGPEKNFYQEILPVKTLVFSLDYPTLKNYEFFVDTLEKNVRLMKVKNLKLTPQSVNLTVETYYLPKNQ